MVNMLQKRKVEKIQKRKLAELKEVLDKVYEEQIKSGDPEFIFKE